MVIDSDWLAKVDGAVIPFLDDDLGPRIEARAKAYCPVESGKLRDSIDKSMDGPTLVISAVGGRDGREYAAYVELGHRVFHPFTRQTGPEWVPARPFLRPALFYGWWAGPVGAMMPRAWTRPWLPEYGFGGDVRGPSGGQAQPRGG